MLKGSRTTPPRLGRPRRFASPDSRLRTSRPQSLHQRTRGSEVNDRRNTWLDTGKERKNINARPNMHYRLRTSGAGADNHSQCCRRELPVKIILTSRQAGRLTRHRYWHIELHTSDPLLPLPSQPHWPAPRSAGPFPRDGAPWRLRKCISGSPAVSDGRAKSRLASWPHGRELVYLVTSVPCTSIYNR